MNILHIDASILGGHSVARNLSAAIVTRQRALHPYATVTARDFAAEPPPHLTGPVIAGRRRV